MSESPSTLTEKRHWYLYDWANSAFTTTVVTLFFGPYLTALAKAAADAQGHVGIFGFRFDYGALWSGLISLSVMTQVAVLPILGAIADSSPRKKWLLAALAYGGSSATVLMFFLQGAWWIPAAVLFLISNLCFGAGNVVYNSFLPDLAEEHERDSVSSKGFAFGYVGGGLLLALNLALYSFREQLGLSSGLAVRISLASAGLWWMGFATYALSGLKSRPPRVPRVPGVNPVWQGLKQLGHTLAEMRNYPQTLFYLVTYLIYNDAIQAVITLSGQFGSEELKIPEGTLTAAILMVQLVAFPGAMSFNWLAAKITAKWAVVVALGIWTGVVLSMYSTVRTTGGFFVAAAIVAMVMGGSQALSRSIFSLMIPKGREAEYFSIYEVSDKGTSWLAPLIFAIVRNQTQSYRTAILSLIAFFVTGFVLLCFVNVKKAAAEAGNEL
jgi:UMF1 family MFS transporter